MTILWTEKIIDGGAQKLADRLGTEWIEVRQLGSVFE